MVDEFRGLLVWSLDRNTWNRQSAYTISKLGDIMPNPLLLPELRAMLAEGDEQGLSAVLELHPATVAEFSEGLTVDETWKLLDRAPGYHEATIFTFFPQDKQVEMATGQGKQRMTRLVEAMPHDDRVQLLRQLGEDVVENLLPLVNKADREDIRRLLAYPEDSAGSLMTTDYATVAPDMSVDQAIGALRRQAATSETIYYIYVLDAQQRLVGVVSLHDLILSKPTEHVRDIMTEEPVAVRVDQDQEEVVRTLGKYDFLAIPVVDSESRLVGIVTHDDVLDVLVEEQTEEVQKMGSVVPLDEHYLDAPFHEVWLKRSLWLSALFVAELFTFTALAGYQHAIESILALSLFVPLCISTGGNSGSQAATLITRALALGDVKLNEWRQVLLHELLMGLALGGTLGLIAFIRAAVTPGSILGAADRWMLALAISLSVAAICLWGTLVGSMLPLVFKRIGVDPGYASSPFVATFVDVTGIIIYFSIAKGLLM